MRGPTNENHSPYTPLLSNHRRAYLSLSTKCWTVLAIIKEGQLITRLTRFVASCLSSRINSGYLLVQLKLKATSTQQLLQSFHSVQKRRIFDAYFVLAQTVYSILAYLSYHHVYLHRIIMLILLAMKRYTKLALLTVRGAAIRGQGRNFWRSMAPVWVYCHMLSWLPSVSVLVRFMKLTGEWVGVPNRPTTPHHWRTDEPVEWVTNDNSLLVVDLLIVSVVYLLRYRYTHPYQESWRWE